MMNITAHIINETKRIIAEKGITDEITITASSRFLTDLPMDSLDLATLIVELEISLGYDPFRDGFKVFHSVGELVALYELAGP
jgi:acyl carrier protein